MMNIMYDTLSLLFAAAAFLQAVICRPAFDGVAHTTSFLHSSAVPRTKLALAFVYNLFPLVIVVLNTNSLQARGSQATLAAASRPHLTPQTVPSTAGLHGG